MAHLLLFHLIFTTCTLLTSAADSSSPYGMIWSSKSFGPDGPWQAVQVAVGLPIQSVALYPGGTFRSHLLTPRICTNATLSPSACFASSAGLYAIESSTTALQSGIGFPAAVDFTHGGLTIEGRRGIGSLDQIDLGEIVVPNVTIAVYDDIAVAYPDRSIIGLQVGTLGLGYRGTENQSFTLRGQPMINGSLIPGYLHAVNLISSNSFGLHIGSVRPKIKGSLYFGGYDQMRICGNVSTQNGPFAGIEPEEDGKKGLIDLLDIAIAVIDGPSPFGTNVSSITNLLASGNSSIGAALSLPLLPEAPYLNLSKSTCDAIAARLPVIYNPDLGPYTWNVADPSYLPLVSSPSVLSFIFRKDQSNTQNLTINIPFTLLNLTLEAPLVTSSTPYFPCNAQSAGRYSLGRAFLQAAFVGANWNANGNQAVWWLAQAPGPNIGSQSSVMSIQDEDVTVVPSNNDWAASWKGVWLPFVAGAAVVSTWTVPSNVSDTSSSESRNASRGLSTAAKAGIGAGIICVVGFMISLFAFLCVRRRRIHAKKDLAVTPGTTTPGEDEIVSSHKSYSTGSEEPSELQSHEVKHGYQVEMEGHRVQPIYEMAGDSYK